MGRKLVLPESLQGIKSSKNNDYNIEATTLLGREVMHQLRAAVNHTNSTPVGDYTLRGILEECRIARDDSTLCSEREFKDKYPEWVSMPVSLVAFKVGILVALIRESIVDVADAPFIIDPTPLPELPQTEKNKIYQQARDEVLSKGFDLVEERAGYLAGAQEMNIDPTTASMQEDFPQMRAEDLKGILRKAKAEIMQQSKAYAQEQAMLLQRELYDRTIEGGYKKAILAFADDFATYPFACMHAPFPSVSRTVSWQGDKFVEEDKVVWAFERVSPFDLWWSSDSTSTQDGTAVYIRNRVSFDYLFKCRELAQDDKESGYVLKEINELLDSVQEKKLPRNWLSLICGSGEREPKFNWERGTNIDILIRYGRFLGADLKEFGFKKLQSDKLYETKIIMCCGRVIYVGLNNNSSENPRPVFTASFESRNNSIVGVGLGQKLLGLHKAYRAVIHLVMYNLGLASEPITEIEIGRILQYMPQEWNDAPYISPGMIINADGDRVGNGTRAVKFTQIPTVTASALQLAEYIFQQCHILSNIPAALHGQPVGSGANRTVRGLLTLQGNTLKPIHSSLMNLDLGVIEPMITLLYRLLVMYEDGFDYTGDCKVVAKGAASMIQREIEKQTAMENLQILGQLGQQINPAILERTVAKLLIKSDILEAGEDVFAPPAVPPQQQMPMVQPQQPQPQDEVYESA